MAYTCFTLIDVSCYDKFFNGNISCLIQALNNLQKVEIERNVTWLDLPATQQQIDAANAGVATAVQNYQHWLRFGRTQGSNSVKKRIAIAGKRTHLICASVGRILSAYYLQSPVS